MRQGSIASGDLVKRVGPAYGQSTIRREGGTRNHGQCR